MEDDRPMPPVRILTAVPVCDGHDSAISTINLEFSRRGMEVVYLGYHQRARDIVRAALQEDVRAIGISSYNGGHVEFFKRVRELLDGAGATHVGLFGGGGGTITPADAETMAGFGVDRIFFAGTPLGEMTEWTHRRYGELRSLSADACADLRLARRLTDAVPVSAEPDAAAPKAEAPRIIGFAGPGGAGKTTLIDELTRRWLRTTSAGRLAVLSHDPSLARGGALLGDRAGMIHCHDDRVFVRSLATDGKSGGLAPGTGRCLGILAEPGFGFDAVLVESVGIGQEAIPFAGLPVDATVFVLHPDYGSRLQLQKIAMLETADLVVLNKCDRASASPARREIEERLSGADRPPPLFGTAAGRHRDDGVDALFAELFGKEAA